MSEFRVPGAKETDMTDEELYKSIRDFVEQSFGSISERRIERIRYRENDPKYEQNIVDVEVGDRFPITGEPVEAILYDESRGLYLVCTPTRGVAQGNPILVGDEKILEVRDFD